MTLKKKKLIQAVKPYLEELGYTSFIESQSMSSGLFCKYLGDNLFLTIGLEIHRYYDCRYTCSFYYSRTTDWAQLEGDTPKNCLQRIGELLSQDEITRYYGADSTVYDLWWDSLDLDTIEDFIKTIKMTAPRIISDTSLRLAIENSKTISRAVHLSKIICRIARNGTIPCTSFDYLPTREVDKIPMIWYMAAEFVRREEGEKLSPNYVLCNAAEAYRRYLLVGE